MQWLPQGHTGNYFVGTNIRSDLANKQLKSCAAREPWERGVWAGQGPVLTRSSPRPCSANRDLHAAAQIQGRRQDLCPCQAAMGSWRGVGRERRLRAPRVLPAPGFVCRLLACPPPLFRRWQLYSYSDMTGNRKDHLCFLSLRCQRAWSLIWWRSELNLGTEKPSAAKFSLCQALNNSREAAAGLQAQEPGELSGDKLGAFTPCLSPLPRYHSPFAPGSTPKR